MPIGNKYFLITPWIVIVLPKIGKVICVKIDNLEIYFKNIRINKQVPIASIKNRLFLSSSTCSIFLAVRYIITLVSTTNNRPSVLAEYKNIKLSTISHFQRYF